MQIQKFTFNPFQENTYVAYDSGKAVIIDPGCFDDRERQALQDFIRSQNLEVVGLLNTHGHLDHVFGNAWVSETYGVLPQIHAQDVIMLERSVEMGRMYGIAFPPSPKPGIILKEGDRITVGSGELEVIFTPGHSPGHVAFVDRQGEAVISGDVLFKDSIGRDDLPGGDYATLLDTICEKMLALPETFTVYSGHGPETTIGAERKTNPFIRSWLDGRQRPSW